ncbi:hypothetical protein H5410_051850, partial [Solanum commersonii]
GFGERTQEEKRGERAKFIILEGLACGFRLGLSLRGMILLGPSMVLECQPRPGCRLEIIMPPQKSVRGRPARSNVEEQELRNAPEVQPQGEVTNAEFREAIKMLSQVVTNQVEEEKLRDREEFRNKKAKIGNQSGQ